MKWVFFVMVWIAPGNQLPNSTVESNMHFMHATFNSYDECRAGASAFIQEADAKGLVAAGGCVSEAEMDLLHPNT